MMWQYPKEWGRFMGGISMVGNPSEENVGDNWGWQYMGVEISEGALYVQNVCFSVPFVSYWSGILPMQFGLFDIF